MITFLAVCINLSCFLRYQGGFIANSFNVPHAEAFNADGNLASTESANFLLQHKNAVKVVLGDTSLKEDLKVCLNWNLSCDISPEIQLIP